MDGNYTSARGELRRDVCDTVIWFDLPRATCMMGILTRIAKSYGQVRPEMAPGCPEKIDFEFFRYVWTYRESSGRCCWPSSRGCGPIKPSSHLPIARRPTAI